MAQDHALQEQRFELKYLLDDQVTPRIRDFVRSFLEIDEFGASSPTLDYPVHSIYLDSDDLTTYRATINGDKNRFKLRVRFYDDRPDTPAFFELKRRMNDRIMKQRGGVHRTSVERLLAGHMPQADDLFSTKPYHLVGLQHFCHLMNEMRLTPRAHVAYRREAWVSPCDNSVRVTIDRAVRTEPCLTGRLSTKMENPVYVFGKATVLELKFTNRFPNWLRELVRVFHLHQTGGPKYCGGIQLMGEHRVSPYYFHGGLATPRRRLHRGTGLHDDFQHMEHRGERAI